MASIPLASGVPMSKDSSCINILTCEHYIKSVLSEVPYHKLFNGITGNEIFIVTDEDSGKVTPATREYLLGPNHWVSNKLLKRVYQNTISILNDPDAIYKAGRNIFKTAVGTQVYLMRLAGVQTIINRLPIENAKFNRNRTIKIMQNNDGRAVVRIYWDDDPSVTKHFCDMNRGVYEGLGKLTGNPATVEERVCQFTGHKYCEYLIKWRAKPFYSQLMDLFRYRLSKEIINELESRIE